MTKDPKDIQIANLIARAETLVADLNDTVLTMKRTLDAATVDIQGAKDDSR